MSTDYGTRYPDLFEKLTDDFHKDQVRYRQLPGGKDYYYVTARTVMNRLDAVVGPENWRDSYVPLQNGILCTLAIRLPDGEWVDKSDAGGHAGMNDEGDDEKSAFTDAFKRAAVKWGIGRIFYGDGLPKYNAAPPAAKAPPKPQASHPPTPVPTPDFADGKVRPGEPSFGGQTRPVAPPIAGKVGEAVNGLKAHALQSATALADGPRTSAEFYAYLKAVDPSGQRGIRSHLSRWGKGLGFPGLIKEWSDAQASRGFDEAVAYMEGMGD